MPDIGWRTRLGRFPVAKYSLQQGQVTGWQYLWSEIIWGRYIFFRYARLLLVMKFFTIFLYQHLKQIAKVVIGFQSSLIKTGELFEAGRQKTFKCIMHIRKNWKLQLVELSIMEDVPLLQPPSFSLLYSNMLFILPRRSLPCSPLLPPSLQAQQIHLLISDIGSFLDFIKNSWHTFTEHVDRFIFM